MNEEPTRRMDAPPPPRGPGRSSAAVKVVLALLVAGLVGLGVALIVGTGSDGGEPVREVAPAEATTTPTEAEPTRTEPTTTEAEPLEPDSNGNGDAEAPGSEESGGVQSP